VLVLELGLLSCLLAVALHHAVTAPAPVAEGRLASGESQQHSAPHPQPARARGASSHLVRATPQSQPAHAILLAAVEAETDADRRSAALERAVESVSDADLPTMLDALAWDVSPGAAELCQLLVRRSAESDAPTAAAWTSRLPESPLCRAALEQVAIAWANTDLPAAASWVQALPEGDSKQVATLALAYEAARTEPIVALELASALPATRGRDDLLVHAVSQWAGSDSDNAAAWAMSVLDPSLRQHLVAAVAVASAEQEGHLPRRLPRAPSTPVTNRITRRFPSCNGGRRVRHRLRLPGSPPSRRTHRAMRPYKTCWPFGPPRTRRRRARG